MNHYRTHVFTLLFTLLLTPALLLQPVAAWAALPQEDLAETGVEFKIARAGDGYAVYMRPTITPAEPGLTLTAQVTIRVPHGAGADRFEATDIQSAVAGTFWDQTSRVDAPAEAPDSDFISFEFDYQSSNFNAYDWQAGQELKIFSFRNSGSFQEPLALMASCDPFASDNSANTNPGNQIAILGLDNDNAYIGTYDIEAESTCVSSIFLPSVMR